MNVPDLTHLNVSNAYLLSLLLASRFEDSLYPYQIYLSLFWMHPAAR